MVWSAPPRSATASQFTVELENGQTVQFTEPYVALHRRGLSTGDLLLFGEEYGRTWYAALALDEVSPVDGCYGIVGVAYDEPDAVIMVGGEEWRGVGLRLPKSEDLQVPDNVVDSYGLYQMGGEYPSGSFCVDPGGEVFALR